jgi:hypothetical protein
MTRISTWSCEGRRVRQAAGPDGPTPASKFGPGLGYEAGYSRSICPAAFSPDGLVLRNLSRTFRVYIFHHYIEDTASLSCYCFMSC